MAIDVYKGSENSSHVAKHGIDSYEKHLERNILKNAVGSGYFKDLTVNDLLGQLQHLGNDKEKDDSEQEEKHIKRIIKNHPPLEKILKLNFSLSRLRSVGPIGLCKNLTICNLSGNFIRKIEPLRECTCLEKLDLHQNQITELPEESFWFQFGSLKILYLHDNGISTFQEVKKICAAENLVILTLYDTPVSLKRHYRHFTINSIWSLKSLDSYVISDEEIIEDAKFDKKFQSMQPQFYFKPKSLQSKQHWSPSEEKRAMWEDISFINKVQGKFSPVLIIQRFTRGFLARSRYQYEQEKRLWAAVTIQRFYRECQGLVLPKSNIVVDSVSYLNLSSQRLDYDTYMQYRRSRERARISGNAFLSVVLPTRDLKVAGDARTTHASHAKQLTRKIYINLKDLESSTSKIIEDSSVGIDDISVQKKQIILRKSKEFADKGPTTSFGKILNDIDLHGKFTAMNLKELDRKSKRNERQTPKQEKVDLKDDTTVKAEEEDGDIPFRLTGFRAPEIKCDLFEELTKNIVEGARDIRQSVKLIENDMRQVAPAAVEKSCPVTTDQKLFIRTHGTMALSCFRAVDQAYKDRDRAKALSAKIARARSMKQQRELSSRMKENRKYMLMRKIHSGKSEAKKELVQIMDDYKAETEERQEAVSLQRNEKKKKESQQRKNRAFATEFACQNNAISKALASHAVVATKEQIIQVKQENAQSIRDDNLRQKEIIRRYTEHRNLLLQSEVSLSRSKLDSDLIQRSIDLEKNARLHVKKARKRTNLRREVSLPCLATAPSQLPPLAIVADNQLHTWEKLPKKEFERRMHDRFDIWLS